MTTANHFAKSRSGWERVKEAAKTGKPADDAINLALDNLRSLTTHVAESSNLLLDPDVDSFYLMDVLTQFIPEGVEHLHDLRTLSDNAIRNRALAPEQAHSIYYESRLVARLMMELDLALSGAYSKNPALKPVLSGHQDRAGKAVESLRSYIRALLAPEADLKTQSIADLNVRLGEAVDALSALYQAAAPALDALCGKRAGLYENQKWQGVAATSLALLAALAILIWLSRSLAVAIRHLAKVLESISHGQLDQAVSLRTGDELEAMGGACGEMIASLRELSQRVRQAANQVAQSADQLSTEAAVLADSARTQAEATESSAAAVEEMAATSQQVAANAEALAGAVEETSASIEEMAMNIQRVAQSADELFGAVNDTSSSIVKMGAKNRVVAQNAQQAQSAAERAFEAAQGGSHAVAQAVEGMQLISEVMRDVAGSIEGLGRSSAEIGSIVEVIDDIADQTNLLALNAAIEAARAGEHGRGFAVVADEVRKLAERSAKATREIADLIKGIQLETERAIASTKNGDAAIQEGLKRAKGAGDALIDIVESSTHASQLIDQIAAATQDQSDSSNLILNAADAMNKLTQRVSEATKEQAAGSELIIKAVERMNVMTRQVSVATAEQKVGGDQMVKGIEHTSRGAKAAEKAATEVSQAATGLQAMSRTLLDIVDFFGQPGEKPGSGGPGLGSGDKTRIGDGEKRLLITQGEAANGR